MISKNFQKENIVKLAIVAAAALTLALPLSATASEKMDITFTKMEDGTYCGKFYRNRWSNDMKYQCRTQKDWEKLGVKFPQPESKEVILGEPTLKADETVA